MALDERLRHELERAARPADPNGVYEDLIRRRERRRVLRRMEAGALTLVVLLCSIGGFYALTRVFGGNGEIATPGASTNGRLAFSLYSEPTTHRIAYLDPDGAGIRFLTSGQALDTAPAWSPDGSKLVFWRSGPQGRRGLWVMKADGSEARPLHETDASIRAIDWSPDGSRIAFVSIEIPEGPSTELDFSDDLYVMNANGTSVKAVISEGQVIDFDWSPDGAQLVIERQFGAGENRLGYDLAIVDADGGAEQALTSNGLSRDPTWSPDGSTIVYVGSATGRFEDRDLFAIAPDGTGLVQLTDDAAAEEDPVFSPDGFLVAFVRLPNADGSACELVLLQPDGAAARVIATKETLGGCPLGLAWQPLPQGDEVSPVPTPTETPPETPSPEVGQDLGLGFPVCGVTSVSGEFVAGVQGTASVATRTGDVGGCPTYEGGLQVLAVDVSGDGLADASYGPLECDQACSVFAAPDVDGDGTDELLVQNIQFSIAGLKLYEILVDGSSVQVVPVTIAPPGTAAFGYQGFEGGAEPQFWLGGDAGSGDAIRCEPYEGGRAFISTTADHPIEALGDWSVTETTFVLEDDSLRVVDVNEFAWPVNDDVIPFLQTGGCGTMIPRV